MISCLASNLRMVILIVIVIVIAIEFKAVESSAFKALVLWEKVITNHNNVVELHHSVKCHSKDPSISFYYLIAG